MTDHIERLKFGVSAVGSAGLGALTVSSAQSGYRTLGAGDDAKVFDVLIEEGTAWEVRRTCTYTHSGTSLSRGTLVASSTGSAVAFTTAAIVSEGPGAFWAAMVELALSGVRPGGRLTLTSGAPVPSADVTGATNVYYTPYLSNIVPLWDGARWVPIQFSETTLALGTLTSGRPHDVFAYISSGVLALELLAWTSDSARATGISLQDGRYCKTGDKTRLYLGTFRTTSTTTTEDSGGGVTSQVGAKRFLWNMYNRARRPMAVMDTAANWAYTSATIRQANGASGNKLEYIVGQAEDAITVDLRGAHFTNAPNVGIGLGIGINSTTAFSAKSRQASWYSGSAYPQTLPSSARWDDIPAVGYSYAAWLEQGGAGALFIGDGGRSGLTGEVWA